MAILTRSWTLLAAPGWGRRVASGVVVMALTISGGLWWLWPEPTSPEATDAPPPVPIATAPPAFPTEQLWYETSSGHVTLAPGGYVVFTGRTVSVRDLFTGELRWEFQHSESESARIALLGADRMVVQFGKSRGSRGQLAFHIPSGERLDLDETRDAIAAEPSDEEPPELAEACGPILDSARVAVAVAWIVLLDCGDHTEAIGVTLAGQLRWQSALPVAAAEFAEVIVADTGHGLAVIQASEQTTGYTDDQLFAVPLDTGEPGPPVPVGEEYFGSLLANNIAAVPEGFCVWGREARIGCYDAGTGTQRWHRAGDPLIVERSPDAVVLADHTLLLMSDDRLSRWIGYRLADGEPQFDLDKLSPTEPWVAHYGDGVLAIVGYNGVYGSMIVVYGDAATS